MKHPYHCMFCGEQLFELSLGFLGCKCGKQFLPFYDQQDNPSISCVGTSQKLEGESEKSISIRAACFGGGLNGKV